MDFERLIVRVCMYSRKNIVLNLKIPAWAVLKFWGFSSLSVLRQSVLRDPTLLYLRRALDCPYAFSHRARCTKTTLLESSNAVAETGRDLVFMTTARPSDLSMPLKGEVRRSPEQSARQLIARSGRFVRHAHSRRALDCEKTTVLCFLPSWSTLLFERGLGEEWRLRGSPQ